MLWVEEFCEVYRDEIGLPWYCFGYPTTIKPRLMKAMTAANCSMIFMGIDSGDEEVRQQLYERPMKDELIYDKAKLIHDARHPIVHVDHLRQPGRDARADVEDARDGRPHRADASARGNVFYPLPKTKLYDIAVEMGQLTAEGEEKVRRGESSFHQDSILEHPHKELAEMLAKVTPVYVKAPKWAKPWLRRMVDRRMKRTAQALYAVLIPVTFSTIGKEAVRITLASTRAALRGGPRRRGRVGRASEVEPVVPPERPVDASSEVIDLTDPPAGELGESVLVGSPVTLRRHTDG